MNVLCPGVFMESTLPFCENMIEVVIHLIKEEPFICLRQIKRNAYWRRVFNIALIFFKTKTTEIASAFYNSEGKVVLNIKLLKLWKRKSEEISHVIFYYIHRHCVKSVQIQNFFWSVFSCVQNQYRELRSIQENTDQKKLCIWILFTLCRISLS